MNQHKLEGSAPLKSELKNQIVKILAKRPAKSENGKADTAPRVLFVVGVNGTGKTTTIGKLANRLKKEGANVMLCAADTFRAAAIEQLEIWAKRSGVELIKQKSGSDPSAVIFDALTAARARSSDLVIVDTAGRLHTKSNLMAELEKMKRTAAKDRSGRAARRPLGARRDYGSKWAQPGARVLGPCGSYRNRTNEARRHRKRWYRRRHCAGAEFADSLRRHG